jgi:hypothetical protein
MVSGQLGLLTNLQALIGNLAVHDRIAKPISEFGALISRHPYSMLTPKVVPIIAFCSPNHPCRTPGHAAIFHAAIPIMPARKVKQRIIMGLYPAVHSDWNHQSFLKSEANAHTLVRLTSYAEFNWTAPQLLEGLTLSTHVPTHVQTTHTT